MCKEDVFQERVFAKQCRKCFGGTESSWKALALTQLGENEGLAPSTGIAKRYNSDQIW